MLRQVREKLEATPSDTHRERQNTGLEEADGLIRSYKVCQS